MPGRTMTRFAAALAAALAALSPGVAQQPRPAVAPPPRPVATECPAPWAIMPRLGNPVTLPLRGAGQECRLTAIVCGPQAGGCCPTECKPAGGPLAGTWVRELPGAVVAFTFAGGEMTAAANVDIEGVRGCVTLTADYAVAKDGTVHGVVTGADVASKCGLGGLELVSVAVVAQEFVGQPFAFRCKEAANGVMLSNVRLALPAMLWAGTDGEGPKVTNVLCGLYKPAKDVAAVPAPKPLRVMADLGGKCDCTVPVLCPPGFQFGCPPGGPVPCPPYATPIQAQPCPPGYPVPGPQFAPIPGQPCPAESGCDMIGQLFQALFGPKPPCPAGVVPVPSRPCLQHPPQYAPLTPAHPELTGQMPPAPACPAPGMPCPFQPVTPAGAVFPPPPAPTDAVRPYSEYVPATPPPVTPPAAPSGIVGEWNRAAGPVTVGLTVGPQRMTVRATGKKNDEARTVVLTAEYRELRDGELVGVITSCDCETAGSLPDGEGLREFADQPVSCRFRMHDGELVVVDVKVGGLKLDADELCVVAGRYKKGKPEPTTPVRAKTKKEQAAGTLDRGALGAGIGALAGGLESAAPRPR